MNCKEDCLNYDWCKNANGCTDYFDEDDVVVCDVEKECSGFKDKAKFAEVKHGKITYKNRPTPAKFAYVKGTDGVMHYGKLYDKMDYNPVAYCSICGKRLADSFQNYCPYCGAKLEGFPSTPPFAEELENILKEGKSNA